MKKLIAWLTKGSRIVKILKYVYGALVAANSSLSGIEHGLDVAGKDTPSGISKTEKYLTICIDVIEKILSWFGIDSFECRDIANSQLEPEEVSNKINEVLEEDTSDSRQTTLTFQ